MSDYLYIISPLLFWVGNGGIKFFITSVKKQKISLSHIGLGGTPSTHTAIVSGMVVLLVMMNGVEHPAVGVASTLWFIVIIDALDLRMKISRHAQIINQKILVEAPLENQLKERIGHTFFEVIAGSVSGGLMALALHYSVALI